MQYLSGWIDGVPRPGEAHVLVGDAARLADWYAALGHAVSGRHAPPAGEPADPALDPALLAALRSAHATGSRERLIAGTAMVWGGLHLDALRQLEDRCLAAAAELVAAAR
jgi:hypothetical protein